MGTVRWEDLTPKEREDYINQDYVPPYKLIPRSKAEKIEIKNLWQEIDFDDPTKLKVAIMGLHDDGKEVDEIAYHVPCSIQYIYEIINKYSSLYKLLKEIELVNKGYSRKHIREKVLK